MKVGTDGVLLGAYAKLNAGEDILDIGTGTGLISLMLAQRFPTTKIDAVEIDENAFVQAQENFENSKFKERIFIHKTSIQNYNSSKKYNLIVSNPPFFVTNDRMELDARKVARQQEMLSFFDLLTKTSEFLKEDGAASFIIPYDLENDFINQAKELNLFPKHILHVKGNNEAQIKRSIITLSFCRIENIKIENLTIEVERHQYTEEYIALTKEFYLKM